MHTTTTALSVSGTSSILPPDINYTSVMRQSLVIPPAQKEPWLDFIRAPDRAAAIDILTTLTASAPSNVCMRWAGGCKGFAPGQAEAIFESVARGLVSADGERYFQGSVGSGGTIDYAKDGSTPVMICQLPYYLARLFPCVAWGSTPQTSRARLSPSGGVLVSKYGAGLDPRGHLNLLTQDSATEFQSWDGDVRLYMDALQSMQKHNYHVAVGVINGGDVTMDEALLAMSKGIPVIVLEGTGRAADQLIAACRSGAVEELYKQAFMRGVLHPETDDVPSLKQVSALMHIADAKDHSRIAAIMDQLGLLTPTPKAPTISR